MMRILQILTQWLRAKPLLARWALMCVPDVIRTIRIDRIGPFRISLRRHRSYWLRHPLANERFPLGALRHLIRPGDVVYDIGANIGLYVRFMVTCFRAGKVIGFEPMTENRMLLAVNMKLGEIEERVCIFPYALADMDGEEDLQVDDMMSASAVLDRVSGGRPSEGRRNVKLGPLTERVRCARLDSLIEREDLPPPNVVKIDIEGAEDLMLLGVRNTLRTHRPKLVVEFQGASVARKVFELLTDSGYSCCGHVRRGMGHEYRLLDKGVLKRTSGRYDLPYLVASFDLSEIAGGGFHLRNNLVEPQS